MTSALREEEVIEEVRAMPVSQIDYLRDSAKLATYVMAKAVCGYGDVNPSTHGAYCKFLDDETHTRKLGLMPRVHLKTSLTEAKILKETVRSPDHFRGLILSETFTLSTNILSAIKLHWEKNELLRLLWPELVPIKLQGAGSDWSANMASINRRSTYKESTYTAGAIETALTGGHWTHIICDDLIGLLAKNSPAEMKRANGFIGNIEPLTTGDPKDEILFQGTRWARNDTYNHILKLYSHQPRFRSFTREAIENGQIIFPAKHTREEYDYLQHYQPDVWYAQYCNNPMAEGQQDLPSHLVRRWDWTADGKLRLFRERDYKDWSLDSLYIVILVDPNSGSPTSPDEAAIVVAATTPDDDVVCLDVFSGRPSPSGLVDLIFEKGKRWRPKVVGIEQAGQQTTEHYFKKKTDETKLSLRVVPLKHKNQHKDERIRINFEPIVRTGRLYTHKGQVRLNQDIVDFPYLDQWNILDAFAYLPQVSRRPYSETETQENTKALDFALAQRNKRTGY